MNVKIGILGMSWRYPLLDQHPKWTFSNKSILYRFFQKHVNGKTLHLCCGRTRLSDAINFDIEKYAGVDVRGDMFKLPFRSNIFDTVLSDPPYKLAYDRRPYWVREILRVIKKQKGSKIVLKLDFIPYFKDFGLKELYIYCGSRYWAHASFLLVFEYMHKSEPIPLEVFISRE